MEEQLRHYAAAQSKGVFSHAFCALWRRMEARGHYVLPIEQAEVVRQDYRRPEPNGNRQPVGVGVCGHSLYNVPQYLLPDVPWVCRVCAKGWAARPEEVRE